MAEVHYLISDASRKVDVEAHVLRYWEDELELKIPRNEMGHRFYTEFHIRLFKQIKDLKAKGINGIDYYIKVLAEKPEWIAEAHQLGMKVNVWTVNDMEMVQKMIDQQVDYITTDYPLETEKLIRKNGGDS